MKANHRVELRKKERNSKKILELNNHSKRSNSKNVDNREKYPFNLEKYAQKITEFKLRNQTAHHL